jgi:hypothetical protein
MEADKTWNNFKIYVSAYYHQHRPIQVETVGAQGLANAAVSQSSEDDLAEKALGAFTNLATSRRGQLPFVQAVGISCNIPEGGQGISQKGAHRTC